MSAGHETRIMKAICWKNSRCKKIGVNFPLTSGDSMYWMHFEG